MVAPMRWIAIAVALLTLVFVGAGCGGGSDEASTDTIVATDTTDESTTDESTTDESTTDESTTDASENTDTDLSGVPSGDCLEAVQAFSALSAAVGAAGSGGDVGDALDAFDQFTENAPEEIRADFQVLAQAYTKYVDVLNAVGLKAGEIPNAEQLQKLSEASAAFNDPDVTAASNHVSAWADENCKGG